MSSDVKTQPVTGARGRTRRAILDAAAADWAYDFSASLSDIADRAEVSRSTLHRYFSDRDALIDAVLIDSKEALDRVGREARAGSESALDVIRNLMVAIIDVGDRLVFLFSDPNRFADNEHWDDEDDDLEALIQKAQAEGGLAADLDSRWLVGIFYSIVYVAAESIAAGVLPRHRAAEVAVRTFLHGAAAHN